MTDREGSTPSLGRTAQLDTRGPYDLAEVATMGFGHRDESRFDGAMRMAFCLDGDYERQVGVELRQCGGQLALTAQPAPGAGPLTDEELAVTVGQTARVVSVDHDGRAFAALCQADPVLARLHAVAPGFRPALFYSPYEAAVWSVISARRARGQGIGLRERLNRQFGVTFVLAGVETTALPTPSQLLSVESVPGLPADRIPRLHAIAEAAQRGELSAPKLAAMDPDEARAVVQRLPGIGPFYSALIVIRACGHADVLSEEGRPLEGGCPPAVRARRAARFGGVRRPRRAVAPVPHLGGGDGAGDRTAAGGCRMTEPLQPRRR